MGADTAEARKLEEVKARFGWLESGRAGAGARDPRTLEVPEAALRKMSPSQQQFWECKRAYADTVLFFKVGKFYELYEDDAEVGARELGWRRLRRRPRPRPLGGLGPASGGACSRSRAPAP